MKVKDLIERLKELDQELEVRLQEPFDNEDWPMDRIISIYKNKIVIHADTTYKYEYPF